MKSILCMLALVAGSTLAQQSLAGQLPPAGQPPQGGQLPPGGQAQPQGGQLPPGGQAQPQGGQLPPGGQAQPQGTLGKGVTVIQPTVGQPGIVVMTVRQTPWFSDPAVLKHLNLTTDQLTQLNQTYQQSLNN